MATSLADEMWGTFAVDDHLRHRAFVAEAVLFDRLLIPSPPKGDRDEHDDWVRSGWQPARLLEVRKRLGDRAIGVPWNNGLRQQWRTACSAGSPGARLAQLTQLGKDAAADVGEIKRAVTRDVIADAMSRPISASDDPEVVEQIDALDLDPAGTPEVLVGYSSLAQYRRDARAEEGSNQGQGPEGNATLFVTWDFLVPEDSSLSDMDLLLRAVALNSKEEFCDSRRRFHEWRRKLAQKEVSLDEARSEMNRCLKVFNEIVAKERRRNQPFQGANKLKCI